MSNNLSQEEIDIFVDGFNSSDAKKESPKRGKSTQLYKVIDFSKPNKLQNENLGALKQIHENFVKSLNKMLTMHLRTNIQIDMDFETVEQLTYQQFINSSNKNCLYGIFSINETEEEFGKCFLQLKTDFCYFYIDKSSGGDFPFTPLDEVESVSEIDKLISTGLFKKIIDVYSATWNDANIGDFSMKLNVLEESTQNLNLGIMNSEMMLIVPIKILIFQQTDMDDDFEQEADTTDFKIGIPYSVIEPVLDNLSISNLLSSGQSSSENDDIKTKLSKMNNTVECFIGETVHTFGELIDLEEGDFISFDKSPEDPVDVFVGGIKKFSAQKYQLGTKNCLKIIKQED